jgi:polyhydroxybutyrate depolymerase
MRASMMACAVVLALGGCSGTTPTMSSNLSQPDMAPSNPIVAARPYNFYVPTSYDASKATPLVILLHGYSANGFIQKGYFGFTDAFIDSKGFLFAFPDGTKDAGGNLFWNATDACCNFGNVDVDDVAYIDAIIDDMSAHYHVDPKRVFVTGHSNGGFMSHRYACDRANRVAAIVALAGDDWKDLSKCNPSAGVAVLQVHGTADATIPYDGSTAQNMMMPSARDSVAGWSAKNGCTASPTDTSAAPIDLDSMSTGAETTKERWTGCKTDGAAELWTMKDVGHLPNFIQPAWPEAVWGWLSAHPKQ